MGLLARAKPQRLAELFPDLPPHELLRAPEIGAVMVRGRIGGSGQPFNLGEMTVTRCALRLASGAVGHGHVQGRDKDHARRAAVLDALMQGDQAEALRASVWPRSNCTSAFVLRALKARRWLPSAVRPRRLRLRLR